MRDLTQEEIDNKPEYGGYYRIAYDGYISFSMYDLDGHKPVPLISKLNKPAEDIK